VTVESSADPRDAEIAELRERVRDLERQLADQASATARVVGEAQEKLYWLERWHVDLDRVMQRRGALRALDALRAVRKVVWRLRELKMRLRG
jgi:hypothetical protein